MKRIKANQIEGINDGTLTDKKAIARVQAAWEELTSARMAKMEASKEVKDQKAAAFATLRSSIEESVNPAQSGAVLAKLQHVESAWQGYDETLAYTAETMKQARESVSLAVEALKQAILDTRQLTLDFDQ